MLRYEIQTEDFRTAGPPIGAGEHDMLSKALQGETTRLQKLLSAGWAAVHVGLAEVADVVATLTNSDWRSHVFEAYRAFQFL